MLINNQDILNILGKRVKKARLNKNFTQDYVSEQINISTDLLRNIENGRNIGSLPTLLNLCNILDISLDYLFFDLLENKNHSVDNTLQNHMQKLSSSDRDTLKEIFSYINENY